MKREAQQSEAREASLHVPEDDNVYSVIDVALDLSTQELLSKASPLQNVII